MGDPGDPWEGYADGLWIVHRDPATGVVEACNEAMMTRREKAMVRAVLDRTRHAPEPAEPDTD